ncbi:putative inorganic carbon transporter subunit DabA [Peredibacter starrii]|uniref:Probable inorganic carbon transporter subunit DabA n=1 Tax=Peredibacter starrii TaxID=28202 RepID=A0AAX4HVN1_9BACT|nr:putative inorganic carbon transporter subunit DabA [Peredibacter starrii]WPU67051.1 putative inorganic carbon transporter subunit DabA [Peredibacter starrii]
MDFNQLISRIRTKLPIQNPLHGFVHNNILLMFENQDFHNAVKEAGVLYRARPYWQEHKYIQRYKEGKITDQDIFRAIDHYAGTYPSIESMDALQLSTKEFFYRLMFSEMNFNDDEDQQSINDQHLWNLCVEKMHGQSLTLRRSPVKWRGKEYWEKYHNESYALSVHPFIIRLISSYLDQGQSFWQNPFVNKGFWSFFSFDVEALKGFTTGWQNVLIEKVLAVKDQRPEDIIQNELKRMEIPEDVWESYILEILFDLKGWSGMVNKLELEPWQATVKAPEIKLVDYIAALILIESAMDQYHAEEQSIELSMIRGRKQNIDLKGFQLSLALYQITNSFKLDQRWMQRFEPATLLKIIDEIDEAEGVHRVRLWHEAYEHHFYREAIEAVAEHSKDVKDQPIGPAQVMFCIDDREESIRRHLEEIDPIVKTYGVVGFFGVDMKFASIKSSRLVAQCPPVVTPSRIISEVPRDSQSAKTFERWNVMTGGGNLALYYHSRTMFRGFFSTIFLGVASMFPMFMQVFFPEKTRDLKNKVMGTFTPVPKTEISLDQSDAQHGYSKPEMAKIVQAILDMCGIKNEYAPLVVLLAHGSSSNNNPFRQAYGCGACGGNAGIPNSRAFAKMANDPEVRAELAKLGYPIPKDTFFVSGFHDTCTDEIHFFNLELMPESHKSEFEKLRKNLNEAGARNAFERCQRFSSESAKSSPMEALKHVKERAVDLAQPRPEYGHSSNALAIVGRREMTRGLYLNRRAFLHTYDWRLDPDGSILKSVVVGGVPVAVNINMDYYFSSVDNENFGCGSKLPLNMTSLLGVMTGSQSDLRIGLARQMVEIHEPIRNLTMIEAPLARVKNLFDNHPRLKNILYHHWMRLVVIDPETNQWHLFGHNDFTALTFEKSKMKHFATSVDLINKTHTEEDFAEIG